MSIFIAAIEMGEQIPTEEQRIHEI
jgi:hypothetical protein